MGGIVAVSQSTWKRRFVSAVALLRTRAAVCPVAMLVRMLRAAPLNALAASVLPHRWYGVHMCTRLVILLVADARITSRTCSWDTEQAYAALRVEGLADQTRSAARVCHA